MCYLVICLDQRRGQGTCYLEFLSPCDLVWTIGVVMVRVTL